MSRPSSSPFAGFVICEPVSTSIISRSYFVFFVSSLHALCVNDLKAQTQRPRREDTEVTKLNVFPIDKRPLPDLKIDQGPDAFVVIFAAPMLGDKFFDRIDVKNAPLHGPRPENVFVDDVL